MGIGSRLLTAGVLFSTGLVWIRRHRSWGDRFHQDVWRASFGAITFVRLFSTSLPWSVPATHHDFSKSNLIHRRRIRRIGRGGILLPICQQKTPLLFKEHESHRVILE